MKRLVLAACLSAPGLAFGQTGDFQPIFSGSSGSVFPIDDFTARVTAAARLEPAATFPAALDPDALLCGDTAIVTVEEEGVRMPDQQFSLPPEQPPK